MFFDDVKKTVAFDGESYYGTALVSHIHYHSRNIYAQLDYNQISPTYRTQTGYDPINSHRTSSAHFNYVFYPNNLIARCGPNFHFFRRWEFDGGIRMTGYNVNWESSFNLFQSYLGIGYETGSEVWRGVEFEDIWGWRMWTGSRFTNRLAYNLSANYGRSIARYDMVLGNQIRLNLSLNLKPLDRMIIEPGIEYVSSKEINSSETLYDGYIFRSRLQYQANREMSFRLVVQFNDFSQRWDIDPLLTYRLNSFTVFYMGSTYDYDQLIYEEDDRKDWKLSSRQFFMKIQYLLQV
jgi:hypothetical protein